MISKIRIIFCKYGKAAKRIDLAIVPNVDHSCLSKQSSHQVLGRRVLQDIFNSARQRIYRVILAETRPSNTAATSATTALIQYDFLMDTLPIYECHITTAAVRIDTAWENILYLMFMFISKAL